MGSFSADISRFVQKTKIRAEVVVRKICLIGLTGVVEKTPVDTGRCRGNWRVSINKVDLTTDYLFAASREGASTTSISRGIPVVNSARLGDSVWITNNVHYASLLEVGHSKQAPSGMLRVTWVELVNYVRDLAARA